MSEVKSNVDNKSGDVVNASHAIDGFFVRYRGQRSWSKGSIGASIVILLFSLLLIVVNSENPSGSVFKVGLSLLAISVTGIILSVITMQRGKKGRKYEGIFSNGKQLYTGQLRVTDNKGVISSIDTENVVPVTASSINDILIRANLLTSGNYLIKDIAISSLHGEKSICLLSYNPLKELREKEGIRIFYKGKIIRTDTIYKEKIINFLEPIEEVANILFPNSSVKLHLDISVLYANYAKNSFLFGLLGIIFSTITDAVQRKTAIRDFLNGEITLTNGKKFGDYCIEHQWNVNMVSISK